MKILFVIIILFSIPLRAQDTVRAAGGDSLVSSSEHILKLRLHPPILSGKYFLGGKSLENKYLFPTYRNIFHQEKKEADLYSEEGLKKLQTQFSKTFEFLRDAQMRKYDLGVVGQILQYASTAAAFGLAAYHINKYYIKKKK